MLHCRHMEEPVCHLPCMRQFPSSPSASDFNCFYEQPLHSQRHGDVLPCLCAVNISNCSCACLLLLRTCSSNLQQQHQQRWKRREGESERRDDGERRVTSCRRQGERRARARVRERRETRGRGRPASVCSRQSAVGQEATKSASGASSQTCQAADRAQ